MPASLVAGDRPIRCGLALWAAVRECGSVPEWKHAETSVPLHSSARALAMRWPQVTLVRNFERNWTNVRKFGSVFRVTELTRSAAAAPGEPLAVSAER